MINAELDESSGILRVSPSAPLGEADFAKLAEIADPFIEKKGHLNGLLLQVDRFPGWENFAAMVNHFRFVRDHHKKIRKIAVVTDAPIGKLAEKVAALQIRVNVVNPDAVLRGSRIWQGDWKKERAEAYNLSESQFEDHYRNRSLLKRSVFPEDIAEGVYFFASELSAKSTGNILNVDAGIDASFTR